MPKKVGIMTLYYKTYNYGAQLQAYALQKTVTKLGYEADVIRFRWYRTQLEQFYRYASANNHDKFEVFSKSIPHSKIVYTPETIHKCADDYEIFVCGSDQIWGVTSMPNYVLPQITLSFVPDNKVKISYAASMGGAAVSNRIRSILSHPVQRLDAVSVRESSAVSYISEMAGKPVCSVLDPAMLLSSDEWNEIVVKPKTNGEYIFVYNIGNNTHLDETGMKLSRKLNCEIKQISYSPDDAIGPAEFIGLIKHAKYILTNSFHGTVFSILYDKEFLSFALDDIDGGLSKNIRLLDLLEVFGLSSRYFEKKSDLDCIIKQTVDYCAVKKILECERRKSLDYLTCSMQIEKENKSPDIKNIFADIPHPARDYLSAVADSKTDAELSYEKDLVEKNLKIERLFYELDKEIVRNEIYCKLLKYQHFGLSLDYDPSLEGKTIVYGAGKIGRLACMCFDNNMLCFVDEFVEASDFVGYPIYRLNDKGLRKMIDEHRNITFLITPVWDFDIIETEIKNLFPEANVVSIEKTVQKVLL